MSVAVELRHITKRFPGVIANKDVSIKVETGTVHALVAVSYTHLTLPTIYSV